ncbi:MAG TPA: hypothetical protein VK176_01110 [Phycisphaerales bacterium]|nr:hypothetical protein [Phycisphaerales bacterium]
MKNRHLLAVVAGTLAALTTAASAQTAVGNSLTYQGRLENNGVLVEGAIEIDIAAYNAESGGAQVGNRVITTAAAVNGLFTIEYDAGIPAFEPNNQLWLSVAVRPAGSGAWTTFPRQKLTASAYSASTRGLFVNGSGTTARVGIGAPAPAAFRFSVDEPTNTSAWMNIDSGLGNPQTSGIQLSDRGTGIWSIAKSPTSALYFNRNNALADCQFLFGATTAANDPDWSTELFLKGRNADEGAKDSTGIVFQNTDGSATWEMGHFKDGTFRFSSSGTAKNWISVPAIEIRGGSDIAEPYRVAPAGAVAPQPGMVVSIDPAGTGTLRVSEAAYDRMVAGIISGANGVNTGLTLTQEGSIADGDMPIAKVGRVWCLVDADAAGEIKPGDLLTTSATPGHAQKVDDYARSQGAILGKAMSSLKSGRGHVLVLVGLQ